MDTDDAGSRGAPGLATFDFSSIDEMDPSLGMLALQSSVLVRVWRAPRGTLPFKTVVGCSSQHLRPIPCLHLTALPLSRFPSPPPSLPARCAFDFQCKLKPLNPVPLQRTAIMSCTTGSALLSFDCRCGSLFPPPPSLPLSLSTRGYANHFSLVVFMVPRG